MKTVDKNSAKPKNKKKPFVKPKKEKVLIVAQEFKFAKLLSGNEKTTRDRVLKTFKKWLLNCFSKNYVFKEGDFIRVWKGLFYAVWMSDKPLIQEELCESIAHILDLFPNDQFENALMMIKVGFKVLATEWYGIDQHRIDKFMMLVRRYLRGSFRCLLRMQWDLESCKAYADMLSSEDGILAVEIPFYARNALSLILHIIDCYLEELAKIAKGRIPEESLVELLDPFVRLECGAGRPGAGAGRPGAGAGRRGAGAGQPGVGHPGVSAAARRLLAELLKHSEPGRRHAGAVAAWRQMGYPNGGPDALELVSDDEGDDEDKGEDHEMEEGEDGALDPRAGRVDVRVEPLPVPAALLAVRARGHLVRASSARARRRAAALLLRFEKLSQDEYPLQYGVPEGGAGRGGLRRGAAGRAARGLAALERDLVRGSDELALRGLRRKHRKRLLARARDGHSIVGEAGAAGGGGGGGGEMGNEKKESASPAEPEHTQESKVKSRKRKSKEITGTDKKSKMDDTNKLVDVQVNLNNKKSKNKNKENLIQNVASSSENIVKTNCKSSNVLANKKDNKNIIIGNKSKSNVIVSGKVEKKSKSKVIVNGKGENKPKSNVIVNGKVENKPNTNVVVNGKVENKPKSNTIVNGKAENQQVKTVSTKNNQEITSKGTVANLKINKTDKKLNQNSAKRVNYETPKKVKFVLKNNCMQGPVDYYQSVRRSPGVPFDGARRPTKTNLKPSTPSPINPFLKKKLKLRG